MKHLTAKERFSKKIIYSGDCWIWTPKLASGLPSKFWNEFEKDEEPKRFSWRNYIGDLPEKSFVFSTCVNSVCVNPKHLQCGLFHTPTDSKSLFLKYVIKNKGCWGWSGYIDKKGRANFRISVPKKNVRAHRFSYELHIGKIPNGMCVLHKCDNPKCTNPEHLFLGTNLDNIKDKIQKGRQYKGEHHHNAKLNHSKVSEIKKIYSESGKTQKEIANMYGVSTATVSSAIRGQLWKMH